MSNIGTQQSFFDRMLPYAQKASKALNIPTSVILSQWANESAYGTSNAATKYNNLSGIMYTSNADYKAGQSAQGTFFSGYNSLDSFTNDYIRIFSLNNHGYKETRDAVSVEDTIKALAKSDYDAGHYGGGQKLLDIINSYSLKKYDNAVAGTIPLEQLSFQKPDVNNMSDDELKKYALLGASILAIIALLR